MKVKLLAFAALRNSLGFTESELEIEDGASVADVLTRVFDGPPPRGVACAVNEVYSGTDTVLRDGDELALLPPVSGGSDAPPALPIARLQAEPIDLEALSAAVAHPGCGAVLTFLGTAREVEGDELVTLEYEAFGPMAERYLADIATEVGDKFGVDRVAIVHRTGPVALGDASVAIAVASPHRAEGFDALRHVIERIKEGAPIWKKEVTKKREHWVRSDELES